MDLAFWGWSFRIGRIAGITVRVHWSLLLPMLYLLFSAIDHNLLPLWTLPALLLIPFISILLHEFGHSFAARWLGGDSELIIMYMFGGLAMCDIPMRPAPRFLVSAAGPAVTLLLALFCALTIGDGLFLDGGLFANTAQASMHGGFPGLVAYAANLNIFLLLFNLIPAYPLDGGAMTRAALWPVVGLRRATIATIYLAYVILCGLFVLAVMGRSVMMSLLVVALFFQVFQEHQALRRGYDPFIEGQLPTETHGGSWWQRWRARRAARRRERQQARQRREESELDRLLEKVSSDGLPVFSTRERRFLELYSRRQRKDGAD